MSKRDKFGKLVIYKKVKIEEELPRFDIEHLKKTVDKISKNYIIERIRNRIDRRDMANNPKYQNLNKYTYQELEVILGGLDG